MSTGFEQRLGFRTGTRYSGLLPAKRRLVDILQRLQFGRIEGLEIVRGEPQWEPAPTIIRTIKLPAGSPVSEPCSADFELKKEIRDLFWQFHHYEDFVVHRLEFRFGLPSLVEITGSSVLEERHWEDRW
jgi:hypothetical protein